MGERDLPLHLLLLGHNMLADVSVPKHFSQWAKHPTQFILFSSFSFAYCIFSSDTEAGNNPSSYATEKK